MCLARRRQTVVRKPSRPHAPAGSHRARQCTLGTTTALGQAAVQACLEDLDTRTARGIDPGQLGQLTDLGWLREHLNLLITGPTGVGKSFIASAFARAACRADFSVRCFRLPRLVEELARYAAMQTRSALYRQLAKATSSSSTTSA